MRVPSRPRGKDGLDGALLVRVLSLLGLMGWVIGVCPWRLFDKLFSSRPKKPTKRHASRELCVERRLVVLLWWRD